MEETGSKQLSDCFHTIWIFCHFTQDSSPAAQAGDLSGSECSLFLMPSFSASPRPSQPTLASSQVLTWPLAFCPRPGALAFPSLLWFCFSIFTVELEPGLRIKHGRWEAVPLDGVGQAWELLRWPSLGILFQVIGLGETEVKSELMARAPVLCRTKNLVLCRSFKLFWPLAVETKQNLVLPKGIHLIKTCVCV